MLNYKLLIWPKNRNKGMHLLIRQRKKPHLRKIRIVEKVVMDFYFGRYFNTVFYIAFGFGDKTYS